MKNFLSKYWKRILILIAGIFIAINVISKCVAPHILVDEFAEYGPNVEKSVHIDTGEIISEVKASSPFNEDMFRLVIILVVGLVAAAIIAEITTKKSSGAKKK